MPPARTRATDLFSTIRRRGASRAAVTSQPPTRFTTRVTLDPEPKTAACAACHDDHHARGRRCAACHNGEAPEVRAAHAPPAEAHVACAACHAATVVAGLVPDRGLCVSCHGKQVDHYPTRECAVCHFGATPEALRPRLLKAAPPS